MLNIKRKLSQKGFSLIELMVAVVILSMAIFGIFLAFTTGFQGMTDARERTVATNYAQEAMEDIKNMDFEKIISTTKSLINADKKYRVDVNVTAESDNLKNVSTIVSWKNRNGITKTVETSMLVNFIEVFASDAAKIVLFTESYSILNSPIISEYASTEITAVIKDISGNTIVDWGEKPGEGDITFSIISTDIFGILSEIQVTPVEGRAYTTFTSNGLMSGNYGFNVIEASVYLPDAGKTVTDTVTIKITNGPVKIILGSDPDIIKANITNYSTITVSLVNAAGQTLTKKDILTDVEITFSVSGEGNLSPITITIPYDSGSEEDATITVDLYSTGNPGLASVIATATELQSDKTDVVFLGPPVAISISANPNPIYVDDLNGSTITVSLLDMNNYATSPTDNPITISLSLINNEPAGNIEEPSSWIFPSSDSGGIINTTRFIGQSSTGLAIINASGGELPEVSVNIKVISALVPDHIKLSTNSQYVKADGIDLSTITAIVYDISGKIVTNYTGSITFETTHGIFTNGNNSITLNATNGIATIGLTSSTSGKANVTVSSSPDNLSSIPEEGIEVGFYGDADHIELNANPIKVKIGVGNTSMITATVCDSNNIIIPNYIGNITFTTDFGTFYGSNPKTIINGTATIELSSNEIGIATINASDGTISSNNICKVEFYEETTLTLVDGTIKYDDTENKVVTFDVIVTGENIEVDEMKIIWSSSSASQKLYKIAIDDEEVWIGNVKSDVIVDIINATLLPGESNISNIKMTFGQAMTGKYPITVIFYPPVSGQYSIELLDEPS